VKYHNLFRENILLIGLVLFSVFLSFNAVRNPEVLIWSDMEGYYTYLPAVFIYGDFVEEGVKDKNYIRPFEDTGKIYTKYTCGVALLQMPFFLAGHYLIKWSGGNTDGLNTKYGRILSLSGLFYFWISMLFLYKCLREHVDKRSGIWSLLALVFGTNLYYYTFFQPAMSHIYSFCLFSLLWYLSHRVFVKKELLKNNKALTWAAIGLVFGMIVLIRPTNIIVGLLPLYFIIKNTESIGHFFREHRWNILFGVLTSIMVFIPQFMYWKYITGDWFLWSYGDESFAYWKNPKLWNVLFHPWNGWILYSPIVLFPLFVLIKGAYRDEKYERIYLLIFAIAWYIFSSWWAWWFGGAFGHRSFVEYLSFLALPMALWINQIFTYRKSIKVFWATVLVLMCYYNIGLTYAYSPPWDGEGWTYESLGKELSKLFFIKF
jgi:hypothetical protein